MFRKLLLVTVLSIVTAVPTSDDAQARTIVSTNTNDGTGNYEFSYETSNGLKRSETGQLLNAGQPDEHIAVEGEYSYLDPDGIQQLVRYTADENGYVVITQPDGGQGFGAPIPESLPEGVVATLLG